MLREIFYLALLSSASSYKLSRHNPGARIAVMQVVKQIFDSRNKTHLDVIIYGSERPNSEVIITVLKSHNGTSKVYHKFDEKSINISNPTIVFVDSFTRIVNFSKIATYTELEASSVLLYIKDFEGKFNCSQISVNYPNQYEGHVIHFAYFLIEDRHQISLKTFEWWTPEKCGETQFVTLNTFSKFEQKWAQHPLKVPEKFTNFHNCSIVHFSAFFGTLSTYFIMNIGDMNLAEMFFKGITKRFEVMDRMETKLRQEFAKRGNFTSIGGVRAIADKSIVIGQYFSWTNNTLCAMASDESPLVALYSPAKSYTNYEKMLMPFDEYVWLCLCLTFGSAFVTILIINQMSIKVRNIIYGEGQKSPMFNVIAIFFGDSPTKVASGNFGRIILMTFVYFCLVIRTAYQGVFFEKFTTGLERPPPETYADLKERNYTIYVPEDFKWEIKSVLQRSSAYGNIPRMEFTNFMNLYNVFHGMQDPSRKSAIISMKQDVKTYKTYEANVPETIKEEINLMPIIQCVSANNFFGKIHVEVMNKLISFGIPQYLSDWFFNVEHIPILKPLEEPKVFGFEDLKFGFVIWMICCIISVSAFIVEILWYNFQQLIGVVALKGFFGKKLIQ